MQQLISHQVGSILIPTVNYKEMYPEIQLTTADKDKYLNMMKSRLRAQRGVLSVTLTKEEYEQALFEARERKFYDKKEQEYWIKVSNVGQNIPYYRAKELREIVLGNFKRNTNREYIIDELNRKIFYALCLYFTGDSEFENLGDFSLSKGIMLMGPVGCGKTSMMRLFTSNQRASYSVKSCLQIAESYVDDDILESHTRLIKVPVNGNPYRQSEYGVCFDDLGIEDVRKRFGNTTNVMAYILTRRYDSVPTRKYTHITTNLSANDIENYYGARVRSRMSEMFNQLVFPPATESNPNDRRRQIKF